VAVNGGLHVHSAVKRKAHLNHPFEDVHAALDGGLGCDEKGTKVPFETLLLKRPSSLR
jgi:hypothetical protein